MPRRRPRRKRQSKGKQPPLWKQLGFRSSLEHSVAINLEERGHTYDFEPEKIEYSYTETKKYIPDFAVDDLPFRLEVKGWLTPEDRKKMLRVRDSNPDIDIRFVFDKAQNKIRKGSKTTYASWCDKHGFKWCEKVVPDEWLNEKEK